MTSPSLPAELKAALEQKLQGLPRNEAASRAALISKTYRDGGNSRAIKSETDAVAYPLARVAADLCRGCREPERAWRDQSGFRTAKPARCRRGPGHRELGGGRSIFLAD